MLQATFTAPYEIMIEDAPVPEPGLGEALVKVAACGICGTDLKINEGHYLGSLPMTPGHEFAGVISALGAGVTGIDLGDRVAINPNLPCRRCSFCRTGMVHLCENSQAVGVTRPGGFAEYCSVPVELLIPVPGDLPLGLAAMMEPVSCCLHGMDLAGVKPGDDVILLGGGSIGLILLQLARAAGATFAAVSEPRPEKRALALELGADVAVDPSEIGEVATSLSGGGAQVVIECAGVIPAASTTMDLVRSGGTIMLFGVCPPDEAIEIEPYEVFHREITIRGCYTNPLTDSRALSLLESNRVLVEPLISHAFPIDRVAEGVDAVRRGETVKAQVVPE
ncbi:MAG TPA: zinc-dependent alcohol dehydrogenase family protein [Armatimonadota bacterium]|nr:zinc-dependent alcohol dehydrogenase family protein [Armatimonadota bacterium]